MELIVVAPQGGGECGSTYRRVGLPKPAAMRTVRGHTPTGVDYSTRISSMRRQFEGCDALLRDARVVACMGNRLALNLLVSATRQGQQLIGAATTEAEASQLLQKLQPDVLFGTDQLEQGCPVALLQLAKRCNPPVRAVIIVTQPQRQQRIQRLIEAGCDGLCLESSLGMGTVEAALTAVCGGGIYIERSLGELFLAHYPGAKAAALAPLTAREAEVLQLAAAGYTNLEIGAQLYITLETVKGHMRNILQKLQARDRTHAAVQGLRLGFVDWPEPR